MRLAILEGSLPSAKASRNGPKVSHLLFANDSILSNEATSRVEQVLRNILGNELILTSLQSFLAKTHQRGLDCKSQRSKVFNILIILKNI